MRAKKIITKESSLHQQVVDYLKYQYPKVLFRTDFAAGIKMTIGQAVKHKKLQKCDKWPDMFIAKPMGDYAGLFLELKKDYLSIYNKKHELKNVHVKDQAKVLEQLNDYGYMALFAVGFDEAKMKIDNYLK
jgi:hypothetical protein